MSYYSWKPRPPRKFRGKPQWTMDEVYISPFTARRRYDEEGVMHYDAIERNTAPTGIEVMDHYLRRLTEGQDVLKDFCRIYGLRTEDIDALIFILTGMSGQDFRMAYQLRLADDLLRYTDLPLAEVAHRSGLGSHTNFCVVIHRERKQTPTARRQFLCKEGDAGRFRL
jgi:AraC-like DNA-binding protein